MGCHSLPQENLPNPGIELRSPVLQADSLPTEQSGKPFYSEYTMPNARLGESQAGIRIAKRSINNLRYVDDTTLKAESEESLDQGER